MPVLASAVVAPRHCDVAVRVTVKLLNDEMAGQAPTTPAEIDKLVKLCATFPRVREDLLQCARARAAIRKSIVRQHSNTASDPARLPR